MSRHKGFLSPHKKKKAKEKRRYYIWWVIGIVIVIVIVAGLLAWGSHHEKVTIQKIDTYGNKSVEASDLKDVAQKHLDGRYLFLFSKRNIFLYPKDGIEDALRETFPRIESVSVLFENLNTISIRVVEREEEYLWCGEVMPEQSVDVLNSCYFMDDDGFIFAKAPYFSGNVYFEWFGKPQKQNVNSGTQFVPKETFVKLKQLTEGITALEFNPLRLIVGTSTPKYIVHLEDGSSIRIDTIDDVSFLLDTLESALQELDRSKQLEYIDLRFGNKVFYKYRDSG